MKRRDFVTSVLAGGLVVPATAADGPHRDALHQGGIHDHERVDGPLANATVSFGAWPQVLDRLNLPPGPAPNVHRLIPNIATIKQGGAVNFIIAGFHHVVVYGPGKTVEDVNTGDTIPTPGAPPGFPRLINDPVNRVYRGLSPFGLPEDRVEVVQFRNAGLHLVICGFVPHFADDMYGWVRVVKG